MKYKGRWVTAEEKTKREDADKLIRGAGVVAAADPDAAAGDRQRHPTTAVARPRRN